MSPDRHLADAEFAPAPAGARLRLATLISAVLVLFATVALAFMMLRDPHVPRPMLAIVGVIPGSLILTWWTARIRRYRLAGNELLVEFPLRTVRIPLEGLTGVTQDREAMRHAWKVRGNGGLGSYSGRFRNKRLGAFRAFLTDGDHAVVLRWPEHCLVISPRQDSYFVETLRRRAGLDR
jgi:hypothetical protein